MKCRVCLFGCAFSLFLPLFLRGGEVVGAATERHAAQAPAVEQRHRYARVQHADELVDGGRYLVAACSRVLSSTRYLLMTHTIKNGRLAAAVEPALAQAQVALAAGASEWVLRHMPDGYLLCLPDDGRGIVPKGSTGLTFSDEPLAWQVSNPTAGVWRFCTPTGRCLAPNTSGSGTAFGHYVQADTLNLMLFRRLGTALPNVQPNDGDSLFVGALSDGLRLFAEAGAVDAGGALLTNGRVAPGCGAPLWRVCAQTDTVFCLRQSAQRYLSVTAAGQLQLSADSALFQLRQDTLFARSVVPQGRWQAVVCHVGANRFELGAPTADARPARLLKAEAPAQMAEADDGVWALQGGWTLEQLRDTLSGTHAAYDLTALALPESFVQTDSLTPANTLFYLSEEQVAGVSPELRNVLVGSGDSWRALAEVSLRDGWPFVVPRSFRVEDGQLSYTRRAFADGQWETLYLPFDCHRLPTDFHFESFVSADASGLSFSPTAQVQAGVAHVFRYVGDADVAKVSVRFEANAQSVPATVSRSDEPAASLRGTLTGFQVKPGQKVFLLDAGSTAFTLAAPGSRLTPFRAYLDGRMWEPGASARLTTGLQLRPAASPRPSGCYDLGGRRLKIPHGPLYIQDGKMKYQPN